MVYHDDITKKSKQEAGKWLYTLLQQDLEKLFGKSWRFVLPFGEIYENERTEKMKRVNMSYKVIDMLYIAHKRENGDKNNIDPSEPEIIERYFNLLHRISGDSLDKKKIVKRLNVNPPNFPFASIANEFKLIETAEKSIFIPLDKNAEELAESIRSGQINRETMRKLGAYTVNVYPYQF